MRSVMMKAAANQSNGFEWRILLAACGASLDSRNEKDYVIHRNRL
jgi:hypothetical protein